MNPNLDQSRERLQRLRKRPLSPIENEIREVLLCHHSALAELMALLPATETGASEQTEASSRTTTADPSGVAMPVEQWSSPEDLVAAAMASTEAQTPLLLRLLGALTEAERTHVERYSGLRGQLVTFSSWLETLVPAAHGTTSTSPKPGSQSFAEAPTQADAPSPSSESSECEHDWHFLPADLKHGDFWQCAVCFKVWTGRDPRFAPAPEPTQDAQPSAETWVVVRSETNSDLYDIWATKHPKMLGSGRLIGTGGFRKEYADHIVALHNEAVR